jgi:hypothetical protein
MGSERYERGMNMTIRSLAGTSRILLVAATLLISAILVPGLRAGDTPVVADAYIAAATPDTNFGTAVNLIVAPNSAALVRFDLSSIPASATISKAYLRLYVNRVVTGGTVNFVPLTQSWIESGPGSVTWNQAPPEAAVFASATASVANTFVLVDVSAQVQGWLAAPATNFGLGIIGLGTTSVQLDSKENTATSHAAGLEIAVVGPAGLTGTSGVQGPAGATGPSGATGLAGAKGATGATGAPGLAGAGGALGPAGPAGPAGAPGTQGPTGATGPLGLTGPTGPSGAVGLAGAGGAIGATGPIGPSGSIGVQGAPGTTGPAGATGPGGAQGLNGPTSNHFNFNTTTQASPFTIPPTDTFVYYVGNNPDAATPAVFNLPTAGVRGKLLVLFAANTFTTTGNRVQINRTGSDTILGTGPGSVTFVASQRPIMVQSDGAGHWILID